MSYQLQEINRRIDQDVNGFLEECDAQYAEKVSQAADAILANLPLSPIVLLSGPSGSGKTTTALKIEEELERRGVLSHTISLDNYFKTLNPKTVPRTADGSIDFESPKCLDMDLLNAHFSKLSKGETIVVPHFEFARQMRNDQMGTPLRLGKNEVAIFEGIHALNDDCAGRNPAAMCLYISARSDVLEGEDLRFKGTWMRLTGRAGLHLPGHRRGRNPGHVGQRPPGGEAVHLPLQAPGQLHLRLLPALRGVGDEELRQAHAGGRPRGERPPQRTAGPDPRV